MATNTTSGVLPVLAFGVLGSVWGSNFIYMKWASELISPMQIVLFRVFCGFFPVLLYALATGVLRTGHIRHVHHFTVMALLATTIYYYGFAKGTSLLLSGVAGAISGSIPLFAFVLAVIFIEEEKAGIVRIGGVLIGLLGVGLIGSPSGGDITGASTQGVLYLTGGSLSLGASFVYAKKYVAPLHIPPAALTTYQLGIGLVIMAAVTDFSGVSSIGDDTRSLLGVIIGLGLLGTGLAYIIYYYIVDTVGAVAASSVTYIPPVVALLIGSLLVGEPIGVKDYCATLLIFAGVLLLRKK